MIDFEPLNTDQTNQPWVTLVRCLKLVEADLIASQLRAADIPVFLPDEYLMQAIAFNVNSYGFIRVQVPPANYEAAREILSALPTAGTE